MDDGTRPAQPAGPDQPMAEAAGSQQPDPDAHTENRTELSFSVSSGTTTRAANSTVTASSANQIEPAPVGGGFLRPLSVFSLQVVDDFHRKWRSQVNEHGTARIFYT